MPAFAVKNTRDPTGVKKLGEDQPAPPAISSTMPVVLVPSVAHSSKPWASSYALNSTRPLTDLNGATTANRRHNELADPGLMSMRRSAVTPSLLHSSHPFSSLAANTRVPLTAAKPSPHANPLPGRMPSRISVVPASVPSVLHNPLETLKNRTPLTAMIGVT